MGLHKDAADGTIHKITNGTLTDYQAKSGATYTSTDLRKAYRQSDDESISTLVSTTPLFQRLLSGYEARVQTTNNTETTIYSFATASLTDYLFHVEARVTGFVSTGGNAASYLRIATFKNDSGTLSIVGTTSTPHTGENDSNWDCQIEASGTNILVRVTGVAATPINWFAITTVIAMKDS